MNGQYWRAETYARLRVASAQTRWPGYAKFAALQVQGLRDEAINQVREFAARMGAQPLATRWEFVAWLFTDVLGPRVVTQPIVPFPLRTEVVVPTLRQMRTAEPNDPRATLWLVGRFTADLLAADPSAPDLPVRLLREQLVRTPDDMPTRRLLADLVLGRIEADGHNLAESRYFGDPTANQAGLSEIRALLTDASDPLLAEVRREQELLDSWQAFLQDEATDFPEWCRAHDVEPPGVGR